MRTFIRGIRRPGGKTVEVEYERGAGILRDPIPFSFDTPYITSSFAEIIAVTVGLGGTFSVAGDRVSQFLYSGKVVVSGSTGNDGEYSVVSVTRVSGNTLVTVAEETYSDIADGILTPRAGVPLYFPKVDEWLLDAWVQILTPWDGTNPRGDIGMVGTDASGLANWGYGSWRMNAADGPLVGTTLLNGNGGAGISLAEGSAYEGIRIVPAQFTDLNPLLGWVTMGGGRAGSDSFSEQGMANLCVVTARL